MNKKTFRFIILFFTLFLFLNKIHATDIEKYTNPDTGYSVLIQDDAKILNQQEISKLMNEMEYLTRYGNIVFKSINENSQTTSKYAADFYQSIYGTENGTLFLIDMDNRYIYIYSAGSNYKIITKAKANIITDNVYKYASRAEYYKCASKSFTQIKTLLDGGNIPEPMKYISNALISIILVFMFNFMIVLFSSRIRRANVKEIIYNCNAKIKVNKVRADVCGGYSVYSPITTSSGDSSSGGGSSGGFSGGGFSGGSSSSGGSGGGHRF